MIVRIEKQAMVKLLHQEPEFAERLLAHLLSPKYRMEADLVDTCLTPAKSASPSASADGQLWPGSKPLPLIAKMSQETMAEMIGTTRSGSASS